MNSMTGYNNPNFMITNNNYLLLKEDIENFLQAYEIVGDLTTRVAALNTSFHVVKNNMKNEEDKIPYAFLIRTLIGLTQERFRL